MDFHRPPALGQMEKKAEALQCTMNHSSLPLSVSVRKKKHRWELQRQCLDTQRYESYVQCGAPQIAKLVNITPITMVYCTYNYSIHGAYKPTYYWGGPHCINIDHRIFQY